MSYNPMSKLAFWEQVSRHWSTNSARWTVILVPRTRSPMVQTGGPKRNIWRPYSAKTHSKPDFQPLTLSFETGWRKILLLLTNTCRTDVLLGRPLKTSRAIAKRQSVPEHFLAARKGKQCTDSTAAVAPVAAEGVSTESNISYATNTSGCASDALR